MSSSLVWITGASSGIGAALSRTIPLPEPRIIDISRSGGTPGTEHHAADLADPATWLGLGAHLRAELSAFRGNHVVFVHAAGVLDPIGFAGEVDGEAYRQNVLLNSAAPQVIGHVFLEAVADSGFGGHTDLVMLSSGAARKPYAGWSSYSAGKAAVDAWVNAVGQEQSARQRKVRVVSVAAGVVATPMQAAIRATPVRDFPQRAKFVELHETGSLRDPDEAAASIWDLLAGDFDNGAAIDVRTS